MLDCTISFSLWWTMVKMVIYTQKCEQKWLKINNRGVGIKMSWVEKNRKINNRVGTILRDSRVVIRNKFTYLIESTCKKNETYNLNSVYLNVLVLFIICTPFRVAPRIEKTKVFKKADILQAALVLQVASWKKIFLLWRKETAFFLYFHHAIIFHSAELFERAFNFKFC